MLNPFSIISLMRILRDKDAREAHFMVMMVIVSVLFVISIFMSLGEVRYALFAQQATARIVQQSSYDITYSFDDNGTARKETVMLNLENQRVAGTSVTVTYIPGSIGSSRLADQSRMG